MMANNVKIGGTIGAIANGKVRAKGTEFRITSGKTKIDGTIYTISVESIAMTWYLNDPVGTHGEVISLHFSSNGMEFVSVSQNMSAVYYNNSSGTTTRVYRLSPATVRGWVNSAYRTLTLIDPPDATALAWLQEFGTPIK